MQPTMYPLATGIAILLTLLALVPTSLGTGTMTVLNHCSFAVWMQVVPQGPGNPPWELVAPVPSTGVSLSPVIHNNSPTILTVLHHR